MKRKLTGRVVIPLAGAVLPVGSQRVVVDPKTSAQQTQRSYLASTSGRWRELSDEARETWRSLGRRLRAQPNGHQAFVQVNLALARCGLPQVDVAPDLPVFGILGWSGLVAEATPLLKLLQVRSTVTADRLLIDATPPLSAGIQNSAREYRQLAIVPGPTPAPADLDLTAAYVARFGAPQPGRRIFLHLTELRNGFKGVPQQCSALVPRQGT